MKEIVKASVAGYSFTFEKEAYDHLESYLNEIQNHFAPKEDGKEIISDIEERMSELLRIDIGAIDRVVTLADVTHLVDIMGRPSDMDEDEGQTPLNGATNETPKGDQPFYRKRLYRDKDSAIFGGVLSGVANYFSIDKVVLRIVFVLLIIIGHRFLHEVGSTLLLAYIVMWMVVPSAKTIKEKLAMSGKDASISDIEAGNKQPLIRQSSVRGKAAGNVIKKILAIFLFLLGASLVACYAMAFFFPTVLNLPSLSDFLQIADLYSSDVLWVSGLVSLLPIVVIFYLASRLLIGFKSKDAMVLGVAFVIWVSLCSYLAVLGVKYATKYKQYATDTKEYIIDSKSDTVYVRLGEQFKYATDWKWGRKDYSHESLKQIDTDTNAWFLVPHVDIQEDDSVNAVEVRISKKAYAETLRFADEKVKKSSLGVQVNDSLVLLNPHVYSITNHWDREIFDITIVYPKGKTIVLDDMLRNTEDWNEDVNVDNE